MIAVVKKAGKILGDGKTPNFSALAKSIGCHRSALYTWKKVPVKYCHKLVDATNGSITLHMLRPDVWK